MPRDGSRLSAFDRNPVDPHEPGYGARRHVVITGTGRAGTTFLVELLTRCGCDTGYRPELLGSLKDPIARAGLEHDIRGTQVPYIVKSPWFCEYAPEVLGRPDILIDHVLVPVRDVQAAALSRQLVQAQQFSRVGLRKRLSLKLRPRPLPGGLWGARNAREQEGVLRTQLYNLVHALADSHVPVTLLQFPRLTEDSRFIYRKIAFLLDGMSFEEFEPIFRRTVRRELVHRFNDRDSPLLRGR